MGIWETPYSITHDIKLYRIYADRKKRGRPRFLSYHLSLVTDH